LVVGRMQTAGAGQTSEVMLEGFTTMNQRWMKRRIEKSRARCTTNKHVSAQIEDGYFGFRELSKSNLLNSGLVPKLSSNPTSISVARK